MLSQQIDYKNWQLQQVKWKARLLEPLLDSCSFR